MTSSSEVEEQLSSSFNGFLHVVLEFITGFAAVKWSRHLFIVHCPSNCFHCLSAMAKRVSQAGSSSLNSLLDSEKDFQDTMSSVNHPLLYHQVTLNAEKSPVFSAMKSSGVLPACIPKAHFFPEFISWLVSSMYRGKCFIMNSQGENILQVSTQLIRKAPCFLENESPLQFSRRFIDSLF